jgi:predicted nucleic acid-binding protein
MLKECNSSLERLTMTSLPRMYIDANILDKIMNDPDRDVVVQMLRKRFRVKVSVLTVTEICCIEANREKTRNELLNIARLVTGGVTVPPFDDPRSIMQNHIQSKVTSNAFGPYIDRNGPKSPIWDIVKNPGALTERNREVVKEIKAQAEDWFHPMMDRVRCDLQSLRDEKGRPFESGHLSGFLKMMRRNKTFLAEEIANIVGTTPYTAEMKDRELELLTDHNIWPYFLVAMGVGCYNRALRAQGFSAKRNPGGVDTWQTLYLAFVDVFVTEDGPFRRLLNVVRRYSVRPHRPEIWSYADLKRALVPIKTS